MNTIVQISIVVIALFFVWRIYRVLQSNPGLMSRENLKKSFSSMGILALILIGFVAILVMLLR